MQHLDEGTIHSWLDGAFAPDEASRVEAHVAECAECASAVAEARGFIAASSRILTKLDDVPVGLVPIARPIRTRNIAAWRAAAAVLVVAVGSLVVLRNRDSEPTAATSRRAVAEMVASDTATAGARLKNDTVQPQLAGMSRKASAPPAITTVQSSPLAAPPRDERRQDRAAAQSVVEAYQANTAATPFAADAMTEAPLRVLREEKAIGGKRTLYAIAAGDTVTLFEAALTELQSVVTTAAAAAAPSGRRALSIPTVGELSARAPAVATDTAKIIGTTAGAAAQSATAQSAAAPLPAAPTQARPLRTISWTDTTSGRQLTLSGRLPVDQLEDIKRRIEHERSAAAAARKPPR